MKKIKNELAYDIYGKKYSQLDEYEKDGINDEFNGMMELMKEMCSDKK